MIEEKYLCFFHLVLEFVKRLSLKYLIKSKWLPSYNHFLQLDVRRFDFFFSFLFPRVFCCCFSVCCCCSFVCVFPRFLVLLLCFVCFSCVCFFVFLCVSFLLFLLLLLFCCVVVVVILKKRSDLCWNCDDAPLRKTRLWQNVARWVDTTLRRMRRLQRCTCSLHMRS